MIFGHGSEETPLFPPGGGREHDFGAACSDIMVAGDS